MNGNKLINYFDCRIVLIGDMQDADWRINAEMLHWSCIVPSVTNPTSTCHIVIVCRILITFYIKLLLLPGLTSSAERSSMIGGYRGSRRCSMRWTGEAEHWKHPGYQDPSPVSTWTWTLIGPYSKTVLYVFVYTSCTIYLSSKYVHKSRSFILVTAALLSFL